MVVLARSPLVVLAATALLMCEAAGTRNSKAKKFKILKETCAPFPQTGDYLDVANPQAPLSTVGDRFIFNRKVYSVGRNGECDLDKPSGTSNGVCTVTRAASLTEGPVQHCDGAFTEPDGSTFAINANSVIGESVTYEIAVTGGTGICAGISGILRLNVVRTNARDNVGVDFSTLVEVYRN